MWETQDVELFSQHCPGSKVVPEPGDVQDGLVDHDPVDHHLEEVADVTADGQDVAVDEGKLEREVSLPHGKIIFF